MTAPLETPTTGEQPAGTPTDNAGQSAPQDGTPQTPDTDAAEPERDNELPDWARKRLTRANAEAANYRTRLREAESRLEGAKTAEEYEQAVTEIKARNDELEQQLSRERVARKYNLPDDLATRLRGTTTEELEADAKALQRYATPAEPVVLSGGLDPADDSDTESDPRVLARRYGGRRR